MKVVFTDEDVPQNIYDSVQMTGECRGSITVCFGTLLENAIGRENYVRKDLNKHSPKISTWCWSC
jgi:hypothetical protein